MGPPPGGGIGCWCGCGGRPEVGLREVGLRGGGVREGGPPPGVGSGMAGMSKGYVTGHSPG